MIKKRKGVIRTYIDRDDDGIENLLYPSFFLGQELPYDAFPHVWAETIASEDSRINRQNQIASDKEFGTTLLKAGQYAVWHQYGGAACSQAILFGIFLPVSTCCDAAVATKIDSLIKEIGPTYDRPAQEEIDRWGMKLNEIGPLHIAKGENESSEALIRFTQLSELYPWLKARFKLAIEFDGPDHREIQAGADAIIAPSEIDRYKVDPTSAIWKQYAQALSRGFFERRINETASLSWENLNQFAGWLSRGKGLLAVNPEDIRGALIWANSD